MCQVVTVVIGLETVGNGLSGGGCPGEGVNGGSGLSPGVKKISWCKWITRNVARHVRTSLVSCTCQDPNQEVVQVVHQQCQV